MKGEIRMIFKVGDKVVAMDKTVPGYGGSNAWMRATNNNQPFLFVVGTAIIGNKLIYVCNDVLLKDGKVDGDYFNESDLIPYTKKKDITETIRYHINPPVTVCILPGKYKGIARCNPKDAWDEDKGKTLALVRALEQKIAKGE